MAASLSTAVSQAIPFLTSKLVSNYSPTTILNLQIALEANLINHYASSWYPNDPIRGSALRCLTLSPTCLPPNPIWTACTSNNIRWFDWMKMLGGTEFDLFVDPGCVAIRLQGEILTIWSDDNVSVPAAAVPRLDYGTSAIDAACRSRISRRTLAQQLSEYDREEEIPSSSGSIGSSFYSAVSFIAAGPDDFSDEYRFSGSYSIASRNGKFDFGIGKESTRASSFSGVVDGNWDRLSVSSRDTFETAQEPPPELLLALGLHPNPISRQTPLPSSDELSLSPVPGLRGVSRNEGSSHEEESANSLKVHSPQYNTSFIRDVSNVCIMGSHINFTTNIVHHDDVRVGLHTLYSRSDPTALHNSHEHQKRMNQRMKAMRTWGSQLLITSSPTPGEYPLSVPSIKTHDLEDVVKDVFTWLYSVTSPYSIMWLYDEYEGDSRTSLIGQCLANFLGDRRDLTSSYFYTKDSSSSQAGTSHPGKGGRDNSSSIIPTIACELTRRIPEIEMPIALTAANDLWIFDLSLDEQMKKLIVDPLQTTSNSVKGNSHKFPRLFLIHGLEDCEDDNFQELFLHAFGKSLALLQQSIPHKLILLGRHTTCIRECFSKPEMQKIVRHRPLPVS